MSKNFFTDSKATNTFKTTLLRDSLLPSLVGQDGDILYWAGKKIAREFVLTKDEEIPLFFKQAGFGTLKRVKSQRNTQTFELTGTIIETRQNIVDEPNFLLEAGFLAETIQNQLGHPTDTIVLSSKKKMITLLVKTDINTNISDSKIDPKNIVELLGSYTTDTLPPRRRH